MRAQRPAATSSSREERPRPAPSGGRRGDAPAPAPGVGVAAGHSPGEILTLQRAVGNRAATWAIERDRHEHGAACGHDTPAVQRSTVHEVLRGGGRPLDPAAVELPALAGPGAQTPVQRVPRAEGTRTTNRSEPYSGRATRSKSKPEADLNAPRLTFTSSYTGPATQRLDTRQSIGFTQVATLHRPDNAALSAATLYDFRQEVTDQFVAYTVDEDGEVGTPQRENRAWVQDGPYRPNYTNPVIQTTPAAIVFNDDPGFSTTSAIGENSWLAEYEVRFRWRVRRRDVESQTWVSSPEMVHTLTSDFDPDNPPQSDAIDHAAAGDHEWTVSL
ncbi:hypothetical protein GA0070558_13810 [Micromonospora haikouensis]|uniref:Uncharacterized protein n=1 Tax=Micromonospora haikouensis TaxID=686309 RepID=A0A1C4Y992_9ACTN|nr:hypothetical protein [Micromonospora haikouensis]SCF17288.1 hypothetical protein GA0070558_13810 [Micromonospora haikouensis]